MVLYPTHTPNPREQHQVSDMDSSGPVTRAQLLLLPRAGLFSGELVCDFISWYMAVARGKHVRFVGGTGLIPPKCRLLCRSRMCVVCVKFMRIVAFGYLSCCSAKRLKTKPDKGGVSAFAFSCALHRLLLLLPPVVMCIDERRSSLHKRWLIQHAVYIHD